MVKNNVCIEINNVKYETVEEETAFSCQGCVFKDTVNCKKAEHELDKLTGNTCYKNQSIFKIVEEKNKYTFKQIQSAYKELYGGNPLSSDFKNALDKTLDPEYDTYIRLKEKFKT